jgi:hypothetical protein
MPPETIAIDKKTLLMLVKTVQELKDGDGKDKGPGRAVRGI